MDYVPDLNVAVIGDARFRTVRFPARLPGSPMYSTCLFCNQSLGANEAVEAFPVGRRLAFDQKRGRLWVVCRKCEKWNLTPLDERWEAMETCERLFRDARKRVCTENIGLARMSDGLELVRIGEPQRPEYAAWRYGDQFGRRRRKVAITAGAMGAISLGALAINQFVLGGSALALAGISIHGSFNWYMAAQTIRRQRRMYARIPIENGDVLRIRGKDTARVLEDHASATGWAVELHQPDIGGLLRGPAAVRTLGAIIPRMNFEGGSKREVVAAVKLVEDSAGLDSLLQAVARDQARQTGRYRRWLPNGVHFLPAETRLAMEMALNEESERRALESELALLELAWQEAEEIAAIADSLALPSEVEAQLSALKLETD